jgi:hypothetical protein
MQDYEDVIGKECVMDKEAKIRAAIVIAVSGLVNAADAVIQLVRAVEVRSPELDKLEAAARQVKETFKEGAKSTVPEAMECKYSIGVLCEHRDFPHKPALCDLGYCPLIAEKL